MSQVRASERDPTQYLIVDPKSDEHVSSQIKKQITTFTKNQLVGKKEMVSMDQFVEMIELEKEYG